MALKGASRSANAREDIRANRDKGWSAILTSATGGQRPQELPAQVARKPEMFPFTASVIRFQFALSFLVRVCFKNKQAETKQTKTKQQPVLFLQPWLNSNKNYDFYFISFLNSSISISSNCSDSWI